MSFENVPGYTDLTVALGSMKIPTSSAPSVLAWNGMDVYQFATGEHIYLQGMQAPHGYIPDTDLLFHVHFTTEDAIYDGETIAWGLEYTVTRPFGLFPTATTTTTTFTNNATVRALIDPAALSGTTIYPNAHLITTSATISGTGLLLSSVLMGDLGYDPGSVSTFSGEPMLLSADAHIQVDRFGSFNEFTG